MISENFPRFIEILNLGDERGDLIVLENNRNIPFQVQRIYSLINCKMSRGFHAHINLMQVLVCLKGQCDVVLDNGTTKATVRLDSMTKGLIVESMIWREMHNFTDDCVLLVLASHLYDEADYIRDYDVFLKMVKNG